MLPDGEFPSENTLLMNVGYQILNDLKNIYPETIGVVPKREKENDLGYDMATDYGWWKTVALQFKSPSSQGGTNQYPGDVLKFKTDLEQFGGIAEDYNSKSAFYVLPPAKERDNLHELWKYTLFIDAYELADTVYPDPDNVEYHRSRDNAMLQVPAFATSLVRNPAHPHKHMLRYLRHRVLMTTDNGYIRISPDNIYFWEEIRRNLLFGDIGRQQASYAGGHAVASDGGEEPIDEQIEGPPPGYTRPPEIIARGDEPPEERDITPETAFDQ